MVRTLTALGAAICLTAAAPGPEARHEALSLSTGQAVIVTVGDEGEVAVVGIETAAPLSAFDAGAVRGLIANHQDAIGPKSAPVGAHLPSPPQVARNRIRIALIDQDGGRILVIANGYDRGFRYRATLRQGDRSQPTDVCTVLPGIRGYEHWPYEFSQIDLRDLRLVPVREGEPPICE